MQQKIKKRVGRLREIKRNSESKHYDYITAQAKSTNRKSKRYIPKKVLNDLMIKTVESNLKFNNWSPQQIAGRLKKENIFISHETIYKYIWENKNNGRILYKYLRRKGKKYKKRGKLTAGKGLIPNRIDIETRPKNSR